MHFCVCWLWFQIDCLGYKAVDSQHKAQRYWNYHYWLSWRGSKDVSQFQRSSGQGFCPGSREEVDSLTSIKPPIHHWQVKQCCWFWLRNDVCWFLYIMTQFIVILIIWHYLSSLPRPRGVSNTLWPVEVIKGDVRSGVHFTGGSFRGMYCFYCKTTCQWQFPLLVWPLCNLVY